MKKSNKIIQFMSLILLIVIIIVLLLLTNSALILSYIVFLSPLLFFIILAIGLYIFKLKITKSFLVISVSLFGGLWGLFSFFLGAAVLETGQEITFIKILIVLPAYLAEVSFGRSELYLIIASPVIGAVIGLIVGLIISWLIGLTKKEKNILYNDQGLSGDINT